MVLSQKRANTKPSAIKAWLSTANSQKRHGKENIQEENFDLERALELSRQEYYKQEQQQKAEMSDHYTDNHIDESSNNDDDENDFQTRRHRTYIPFKERQRMLKNKKRKTQPMNNSPDSELLSSNTNEVENIMNHDGTTKTATISTTTKLQQTSVKIKKEIRLEAEEEIEVNLDDSSDEETSELEKKVKQEVDEKEDEVVIDFDDSDEDNQAIDHDDGLSKRTVESFNMDAAAATTTTDTQDDIETADLTNWTPSSKSLPIYTPSSSSLTKSYDQTPGSSPYLSLEDPPFSSSHTVTNVIEQSSSFSPSHTISTTNNMSPTRNKGKGPARIRDQSNDNIPSTVETLNIPKRRKRNSSYSSPPVLTQDSDTSVMNQPNNNELHGYEDVFDCPNCHQRVPLSIIATHESCMNKNEQAPITHTNNLSQLSSNQVDHWNSTDHTPSMSLIDDNEDMLEIQSSRERRQRRLDQLSSRRNRRTPRCTPPPIYNETHSEIEEFPDDDNYGNNNNAGYHEINQDGVVSDGGRQGLKDCPICFKLFPEDELQEHVNEELNAQEPQSSAEPPSSSTMGDLRDSFNIVTVSDEDESGSDNDDAIDLSGLTSPDHDGYGNYYDKNEDDDGRMSPLRGFVNINPEENPEYYNQGASRTSSSRQRQTQVTPSSSSTRARPSSSSTSSRNASRQGRTPRASSSARNTASTGRRRLTAAQKKAIYAKKAAKRNQLKGGSSKKPKTSIKSKSKK